MKKSLLLVAIAALSLNMQAQPGGGGGPGGDSSGGASTTYAYGTDISSLWQSGSDYYYIVGLFYCSSPADETYEQMGIYVPSAYLTKNSDGSFSINTSGTCNGYTAATAPIVVPVNTSGYSAQSAPVRPLPPIPMRASSTCGPAVADAPTVRHSA